jgi:predicted lactoylglutathione lyase
MNRLNLVTLGTRDIVKAHRFYKELGFDLSIRGPEPQPAVIFFRNEGSRISLYPIEELARDINSSNPPEYSDAFSGITLAYNAKSAEEVDRVMARAEQVGAKIVKQPEKTDWGGYGGYFSDPDGYCWEVAFGEMWQFDESNMLVIE